MSNSIIEDIYPLSPMQQGLLFHTLYAPKAGVYFQQLTCALGGRLQISAFLQAWQRVIDRHPILRTCFAWEDLDEPVQVVYREVKASLTQENWRGLSQLQQEDALAAFLKADREQEFELSDLPLMRLALIRLDEDVYRLLWSFHHILLDGWSVTMLLKEVLTFYHAIERGEEYHMGNTRPYRDYIALLQRQDLSAAESFWRQTLKGFTSVTSLGLTRHSNKPNQDDSYREQYIHLSKPATAALQAIARNNQLTLSTIALGAWGLLLGRYSGEKDVVFGVTISGRSAEIEGIELMAGLFINTLPARVQMPPQALLVPWLKDIQNKHIDMHQYHDTPLVQVQSWSEIPRGRSLFDSIIIFGNYPEEVRSQARSKSLQVSDVRFLEKTNYPLTIEVAPGSELWARFMFDTSLLDGDGIVRMANHYQNLLENIAANPHQRLANIGWMAGPAEQRLLIEWNDTFSHYPSDSSIHELFQHQADLTPDAVALIFEQQSLTYAQLNSRANSLAHYLRSLGVGPELLVGLCLDRSIDMVVALLAILKAGAAYVPLDPSFPGDRLAFLLRDAQISVLLTHSSLLHSLPLHDALTVCLDSSWPVIETFYSFNPVSLSASDNLAYVIYTSGSTGLPKGVQITHQSVVNFLSSMLRQPGLAADDVFLALTTLCFDIAALELFLPLIRGATLLIVSRQVASDPSALSSIIHSSNATVMQATPATWKMLIDSGWQGSPQLKILCGGEALPPNLALQLVHRCHQLWNLYGPTETTIWSAACTIDAQTQTPSIGKPISNTQIFILDHSLNPVPIGVPAQLFIAGDGLSRGYLNRPDLTALSFIPNPFSSSPGARMYRSGDLARFLPDGSIDFLGRIDNQVKLRGFRIELGEIESAIAAHPLVDQAVVILCSNSAGDKMLAAYFVSVPTQPAPVPEIKALLNLKLPDYMIPSAFISLERFPLTPNGKLDRKALPAPDLSTALDRKPYIPPSTPVERQLCDIWSEVLGISPIGVHDNFFDLGGHSLLTTQLAFRIRKAFDVHLPLHELFESPTVAGLGIRIDAHLESNRTLKLAPASSRTSDRVEPLSFAQRRLWFLERLWGGTAAYNMPIALRLEGELNVEVLERTLNDIISRHEALRTNFAELDGEPVQLISPIRSLSLNFIDLSHLSLLDQHQAALDLCSKEAASCFDLKVDLLLRASLLRLDHNLHFFSLTIHHIISDGWSLSLLLQELSAVYQAFCFGQPSPLAPPTIQYADYAVWQRDSLHAHALQLQLAFWKHNLSGAPPFIEVPSDFIRPARLSSDGHRLILLLPSSLSVSLLRISHLHRATLFMTLAAAVNVVLHFYTSSLDILLGTDVANRDRPELLHLIGYFSNQLVLRTDLSGNPSFSDLILRVRQVAIDAFANQDAPFDQVVEAVNPKRDLSRTPLYQVKLVYENLRPFQQQMGLLKLSPLAVDNNTAKYDITFFLEETINGIEGEIEYNSQLYKQSTIAQLATNLKLVLDAAAADPAITLTTLIQKLEISSNQYQTTQHQAMMQSHQAQLRSIRRKAKA